MPSRRIGMPAGPVQRKQIARTRGVTTAMGIVVNGLDRRNPEPPRSSPLRFGMPSWEYPMSLRVAQLRTSPDVFQSLTGLTVEEFDTRAADCHRILCARQILRAARRPFRLGFPDQLLLMVLRLRHHLTQVDLGALFGISDSTALRVMERWLPALEEDARFAEVRATNRSGKTSLSTLLAEFPDLAELIGGAESVCHARDVTPELRPAA